ncbi:MAG: tetratricopeptide repeat protein [Kiritimatiellia bacterium]|nr:tetratricopeptide repeat protein [Kiritimatiellia bacterium]
MPGKCNSRYPMRLILGAVLLGLLGLAIFLSYYFKYRGTSAQSWPLYVSGEDGKFKGDAGLRRTVDELGDVLSRGGDVAGLTVEYPGDGSLFPPDFTAPSFRWVDQSEGVDAWIIDVELEDDRQIYAAASGVGSKPKIDPRCVTDENRVVLESGGEKTRTWTPGADVWEMIKKHSVASDAVVSIHGIDLEGDGAATLVSSGSIRVRTSRDPVAAPIFYRDVPLMPSKNEEGLIKPLATRAIPLIEWRLRDLSKPESSVVMKDMPTCANCHSFSIDGKTMGMDMDGPRGDKGAYSLVDISEKVVIEEEDVFSWNTFKDRMKDHHTLGLMSQVSPDGRYVVSTVNESLFVCNYMDFRFLQTFYPTRGILAVYSRKTGKIRRLPGADDSGFVQACPVWTPDGKEIIFLRAAARPAYDAGPLPVKANDPREPKIQYDLYRIPFNGGRGGKAEPVVGASRNGMSNSFPKCSPDGKWIVFVQCRNGMLMRPDSRLYIIPAKGGAAREMNCNTSLMNSWHSWSPNSRWLVFSSKANTPFTQMFLTHVNEEGSDSPAILVPNSTAANRAVNIPEFVNIPASALASISSPAVDYRRLMEKGNRLALDGKLSEAESVLRKSLALRSDYPDTHANLAYVLNERGRYLEAIDHCRKALAVEPRFAEAHNNWGNALVKLQKHEEAVERYRLAVGARKKYDVAHINLGRALTRLGRYEESLEHFAKAADAAPDSVAARTGSGRALTKLGRLARARESFLEAVKIDPGVFAAHSGAGDVCLAMGRLGEAIQCYKQALVLRPASSSALSNLGSAYLRAGRLDEAVDAYKRVVSANEKSGSAHHNLATALSEKGMVGEAIASYRRAIALESSLKRASLALAWLLATTPDTELRDGPEAVKLLESTGIDPGKSDLAELEVLAAVYAESGRFDEAVSVMERIIREAPVDMDMLFLVDMKRRLNLFKDDKPLRVSPAPRRN